MSSTSDDANVVEFPNSRVTAHSVLDTAKETLDLDGNILCLYADKEGNMVHGNSGFSNEQLLWYIECYKKFLLGD